METKPDKAVSIIECDMNVSTSAACSMLGPGEDGQSVPHQSVMQPLGLYA